MFYCHRSTLQIEEFDDMLLKQMRSLEESRVQRYEKMTQEDEEILFGKYVASVLRRLENKAKTMAKLNIQQVLTNAEFQTETSIIHSDVTLNY